MTPPFRHYLALGDSISIDEYPAADLADRRRSVDPAHAGAASLFYQNRNDLWPEFKGRDLATLYPGIVFTDRAEDGETTEGVLHHQLPRLPRDTPGPTFVTLTAGGNDLLNLLGAAPNVGARRVEEILSNLRRIVSELKRRLPDPTIIVGTVYDPSDGTRDLGFGELPRDLWKLLGLYNDAVKRIAAEEGCLVADIHGHFLGHGLSTANPAERWYWDQSIIEPNARGASEVRRLWLRGLDARAQLANN